MKRRRGFTLIELIIVVGISGIIVTAGVAPLVYTVRLMQDTKKEFDASNRELIATARIFRDILETTTMNVQMPVNVIKDVDSQEYDNQYICLWTTTGARNMQQPLTTVVYGVYKPAILDNERREGLYRWVLSDDTRPNEVVIADILEEDYLKLATLIVPDVKGLTFHTYVANNWLDTYSGIMPEAMRVCFEYDKEDVDILDKEDENKSIRHLLFPQI